MSFLRSLFMSALTPYARPVPMLGPPRVRKSLSALGRWSNSAPKPQKLSRVKRAPSSTMTAVVGASGALYGVLLAFAHYWPDERILIIPIPVPIRIRTMVVLATLIAIGGIAMEVFGSAQRIAHHAHLGGFLGAWLFMKWREKNSPAAQFKRKADGGPKRGWLQDRDAAQRWAAIDRESLHPVNREAYDEIMHKLRTQGLPGLTDRERAFLDRFSQS